MAHQRIEIDDLNRRVESLLSEPSSTSASDSTAYTKELEQIIELLESEREDLESECTSLKDSLGAIEESMESQSAQDAKIIETLRQDLMDSEEVRIVPYTYYGHIYSCLARHTILTHCPIRRSEQLLMIPWHS